MARSSQFKCHNCGQINTYDPSRYSSGAREPLIEWKVISSSESLLDTDVVIDCSNCNESNTVTILPGL